MAASGQRTRGEAVCEEQPTLPSSAEILGGRYAVQEELGRGGMGLVLRARDVKVGREVAIKLLAPGAHTEEQRLDRKSVV